MSSSPRWFGPETSALFGWFHLPDDECVRSWAVLCPALGFEAGSAHYAYRKLAERLAEKGVGVLRFDYEGTGDSAGAGDEPGRARAWRKSFREAVAAVRCAATVPVVAVGMRMGATIAFLEACDGAQVDGLVLWDPCPSGRSFLRQQAALMRIVTGIEPSGDGSVEVMGLRYGADAVEDLRSLDLSAADPASRALPTLVLWRSERVRDRVLEEKLACWEGAAPVEWATAEGQDELFAVGRVPEESLEKVVSWTKTFGGAPAAVSPLPGRSTVVVSGPGGAAVSESALSLGPVELFGVMSEPLGGAQSSGANSNGRPPPVVMFFNFGISHHDGPGRMWVELGRSWAAKGLRCLRVDRSGIGDSPVRPGQTERMTFPPEAVDDARDLARAVSPEDPSNVVLIGVCAGAYLAVEGGISLSARGVCAVNPVLTFVPQEHWTGQTDPGRRAVRSKRWWMKGRFAHSRWAQKAKPHIPWRFWWALHVLGVQRSPGSGFEPLVEKGADTLVICDGRDAGPYLQRSSWILDRLSATGRFRFESSEMIDHLLLTEAFRDYVGERLTENVVSSFAPAGCAGAREPGEEAVSVEL